ncbi:cyclin cyclophilin like peptidyl-prolyl cis-trans isomerase [Cryptosporidium sp. chipmunk genotype I]|uniref:cyclin cyclophilin like peptidyl-prolyl cis-trans isomerase n=1 Tax=Cryptosporidium sp. chipmunk genotype I TaxID=1280935 RepID=UPI00351A3F32|nr:cyclin cyclophilin like peptidyl-prolyl cis-trans isomerase [Cryptosporidium sp. chipmunk genotype I]
MSSVNQGQESESSDGSEEFGPGFTDLAMEGKSHIVQQFGCSELNSSSDRYELDRSSKLKTRRIEAISHNQVKGAEEEDDDCSLGPIPEILTVENSCEKIQVENKNNDEKKKNRERELEKVVNIPKTDFYECSFMHKKQVTHIISSNKTGFTITASKDGVIKFWRLRSEKEISREKESHTKELSSPVITSLEFVKGFQAHKNEVSDISISNCEQYMASISEFEKDIKLYSISNFDMISIIGIPIHPNRCVFLSSLGGSLSSVSINNHGNRNDKSKTSVHNINTFKLSNGLIYPQIVVSEVKTGSIYIYSIKGGNLLMPSEIDQDNERFPKYNNHKSQVTCLKFLPNLGIIISGDISGGLEFWDPWTMTLPRGNMQNDEFYQIKFQYKIETDLFELQKNKCYAVNMVVSHDERNLAIRCSDYKIRLFLIQTGKCYKLFDENISSYNIMQNNPEYDYLHIDHLEFGVRSAIETEIQNLPEYYNMQNMVFDETCRFIIYTCMIGICVLDVQIGKRILIIGKFETGKRFLNLGLLQIHRGATNYNDVHISNVDSAIITSAYKSNRIYVFSKRLPLLDNGDVNLKRDIFNELPSNEEIERQKQLEQFSSKEKEKSNAYIRIAKQVILHTTKGDITLELYPEIAPKACENFSVHCFNGYYNNCIFHRVIKGFMIQTGDPTGQGIGGISIWGKEFEDEISPDVKHDEPFTLSMANAGPNTNGSQFFITTASCPWLDGVHTIFGKVVHGKEVVKEIEHVSTNRNDRPIQDISIISASTIFN